MNRYPYENDTYIAEQNSNSSRTIKRYLRQLVAVTCALSLTFGALGGLAVGRLLPSAQTPAATGQDNTPTDANAGTTNPVSSGSAYDTTYATAAGNNSAMSTSEINAKMADTVVSINVEAQSSSGFNRGYVATGSGSGVIIDTDGYIVTNNHVISGASKINVVLKDGTIYEAKLLGTDSKTDIALLKIEATGLHAAPIGDSSALAVGEPAIAIGNPLGQLGGTLTQGVISGLDREINLGDGKMNLLQIDAAVNPGNSGGALFNNRAELIGIVVAKTSAVDVEGIGFAIPINDVKPILEQLRTHGYVTGRPALGISVIAITDPMTAMSYRVSRLGVYIADILENSNVAKAGLLIGDCFVSIDGKEVGATTDIASAIADKTIGDEVEIVVLRGNETVTVRVALVEEKSAVEESSAS